ncbi:F0F1 ATP synthase subunit B [Candidatus Gracilibacteria bacterium]|nr:F0F1 ATP synthase subunit B [Candidatus Gracilibacteria bacterium]
MDDLKLGIVIAQIINFGILFFLFKHFLGAKIVKAIEERRKHLKASAEAEDIAEQKKQEAEKEAESILSSARKKASEIESYAEEMSKNNAAKALERAEKEADHIITSGRDQIEKERLDMVNVMKEKVVDLSLKLNSKLFSKEAANKDFMEKEFSQMTK